MEDKKLEEFLVAEIEGARANVAISSGAVNEVFGDSKIQDVPIKGEEMEYAYDEGFLGALKYIKFKLLKK